MQTEWFMVMGIGYSGNVRGAVTARICEEQGIDALFDLLHRDPDAERSHLLRAKVSENGLRNWVPVKTIRRAASGAFIEQGPSR